MKLKMKWALNNEGKKAFVGYEIVAENESEQRAMGTIRNRLFWGDEDEQPRYGGMTESEDGRHVASLKWEIPANMKRLKAGELHDPYEEVK